MKSVISFIGRGVENLFLWSSGASLTILKEVPSEKSKYFGVGGTVLFTAMMATLAGGYAFYTAFKDTGLSIGFGIFWGCMIFNLDRYIVSSFGSGDGQKTISLQEIKEASPRLILAIFLGIVISTPLEMKLFEKEITTKLQENNAQSQARTSVFVTNDAILNARNGEKLSIQKQDSVREKNKTTLNQKWQQATKDMNDEFYKGKFSGRPGGGTTYKNLKIQAEAVKEEYYRAVNDDRQLDINEQIKFTQLDSAISRRQRELDAIKDPLITAQAGNDGFLARYKAFSDLSDDPENKFYIHPITIVKSLIALLFILIEIAPILFKMLTERGPYDDIMDLIKYETRVRQMELQSNLNQEINTAVQIHTAKFEQKLKAEVQTNEEVLKAVAKAQQELALIAIAKWKEEQKAKMQQSDLHGVVSTFG